MEPNLQTHRTEYQRLASTSRRREHRERHDHCKISCTTGRPNTGGSEVSWKFTGKPFTQGISNREAELREGCGIHPKVWPDNDVRISEIPVTCRRDLQFATTAMAAHGGYTPRKPKVEKEIAEHKRQLTVWHEHDHTNSSAAKKTVRPLRVAGLMSARLGYLSLDPGSRVGMEDRPSWMREDETLPGGFLFTPSDPHGRLPASARGHGDPSRFGKDAHFTATFTQAK